MAKANSLTAARLRELLSYDPETGVFTRRVRTSNSVHVGDVAGGPNSEGYIQIRVDGRTHAAARLAHLYITGEWPTHQIDHKDTDNSNNRWVNLRPATGAQNKQNMRKARSDNKCGLLGVRLMKNGKAQSEIKVGDVRKFLGTFDTPELAHAAYLEAKARLHPFQTIVPTPPRN